MLNEWMNQWRYDEKSLFRCEEVDQFFYANFETIKSKIK